MLDASSNSSKRQVDLGRTKIGDSVLVGSGAIGNAVLWVLSRFNALNGDLHVVDHELTDDTNPQRYVLTTVADVGRPKTAIATNAFEGHSLRIVPHERRWQGDVPVGDRWDWRLALLALDSSEDRIAVQSSLPYRTLNAWTQSGEAAVSRHRRFGVDPCAACLYMPAGKGRSEAEIIAAEIGLPKNAKDVATMLFRDTPMPRQLLEQIAAAKSISFDTIAQFEGQSLKVFRHKAICGGLLLTASNGMQPPTSLEAPMAFQSALAGVMLAAEMVLEALGERDEFGADRTVTRIDLLRPVPKVVTYSEVVHASCICQDNDYREVFRTKFLN